MEQLFPKFKVYSTKIKNSTWIFVSQLKTTQGIAEPN